MGEHCTQGTMDLTWQEILCELQGLDMHPNSTYGNPDYVCQQPTVPLFGCGPASYPRDGTVPNGSQSMQNYNRLYLDPISPQAQQVPNLTLIPGYGPMSYTEMPTSNITQICGINHYPSKRVPASGIDAPDHIPMPAACPSGISALQQPCKGQEDFESDSGLSLNFSDGESIEIENIDTHRLQSEYTEIVPPHAYQGQYPLTANMVQSLGEQNFCEVQPYVVSRTLDLVCSRDERRAVALQIPFPTERIVNLPVEDFNELLSRYTLTEPQLALVRDIRRRGKNKVAAQNCRKRKMENIAVLEKEIGLLRAEREGLCREREEVERIMGEVKDNLKALQQEVYHILQNQGGQLYQEDLLCRQTLDANTSFTAN
ncbi:transcription factor NF-E2 45 kDa subunit [Hyperolius riggenbachi]|uniref:transcription factor NF-E2 45 kDa subunit n=1 Tax=Hyperolius riggenbachi TaxID=752182 RepID=UPI0035A37A71